MKLVNHCDSCQGERLACRLSKRDVPHATVNAIEVLANAANVTHKAPHEAADRRTEAKMKERIRITDHCDGTLAGEQNEQQPKTKKFRRRWTTPEFFSLYRLLDKTDVEELPKRWPRKGTKLTERLNYLTINLQNTLSSMNQRISNNVLQTEYQKHKIGMELEVMSPAAALG